MYVKAILLCVSACFISNSLGQCFGREPIVSAGYPSPFPGRPFDGLAPYDGLALGSAWPTATCGGPLPPQSNLATSYGGGLAVTSSSPISPTGLTVTSENAIEGTINVAGQLPFLGAVATDGLFNTMGLGTVSYGCGDGAIGIVSEAPITPAVNAVSGYGPGPAPYGYGPATPGYRGYSPLGGCGSLY